jgi:hypothetical protein
MPIACVHCAKAKAKCDKKVSRALKNQHTTEEADMEVNRHDCGAPLARQSVFDLLLQNLLLGTKLIDTCRCRVRGV